MSFRSIACRLAVGTLALGLVGGCSGGPVPSGSPPAVGAATPSVSGPPASATATPAPTPAWSAEPAPEGWVYRRLGDVGLEIALPAAWRSLDVATNDPADVASAAPEDLAGLQRWDRLVAEGAVRLAAAEEVTTADGAGYRLITVLVERGDPSLAAFADRVARELDDLWAPTDLVRAEVRLPAGPAAMLAYSLPGDAGARFVEVGYLLRLADGRSLTLGIAESLPGATVDGLRGLARTVAGTLREVPSGPPATPTAIGPGTRTPDTWIIDLTLPTTWRWTWDAETYQAVLDELDPDRRAAMEAIAAPSVESWIEPYAVDTASDPLPGGGLTMLLTSATGSRFPDLAALAADRRSTVPAEWNLLGVELLQDQVVPVVRSTYRMARGEGEVALVGYEFLDDGTTYALVFMVPVEGLESQQAERDAIIAGLRIRDVASPSGPPPTP